MKSWGFSRMCKQWIPGHFSLLPRAWPGYKANSTFYSLLFSLPSHLLFHPSVFYSSFFLLLLPSSPLLLSPTLSLSPPPLFPLHIVSVPVAKTETSKATAFGSSLGSSLAPTKPAGIGSAHSSLATIPRSSPAQHLTPSPHHPHQRSVRGNILGFLRKKDKVG